MAAEPTPSLEYQPPRPVLPEPKAPTPAPPVTIFREAIGGYGIGTGSFDQPTDVAVDANGNFYVLDAGNSRVQKFDNFSNFLLSWGSNGSRPGEFNKPKAIALGSGGFVYVVDTGNHRIQKFDSQGHVPGELGGATGAVAAGDSKIPRGHRHDADGNSYVLDTGNERIQKFDVRDVVRFDRVGRGRSAAAAASSRISPRSPGPDERFGYLYLLGAGCLVQQFQLDGTLVKSWSAVAPESGLCVPARIKVDNKNDYVYMLDAGNGLLARFNLDGRFLAALRGAERPFSRPLGFAVNPDRDEVLVADTENSIVQKFTLR